MALGLETLIIKFVWRKYRLLPVPEPVQVFWFLGGPALQMRLPAPWMLQCPIGEAYAGTMWHSLLEGVACFSLQLSLEAFLVFASPWEHVTCPHDKNIPNEGLHSMGSESIGD